MALAFDDIWTAWQQTGTDAGYRVPLTPHGGNVRAHLTLIRDLVADDAELRQALGAWWRSPAVPPDKRVFGMFAAQLTGVLHTLQQAQAAQAWCSHTPECHTQAEHTRRLLDEERVRRGLAPRGAQTAAGAAGGGGASGAGTLEAAPASPPAVRVIQQALQQTGEGAR